MPSGRTMRYNYNDKKSELHEDHSLVKMEFILHKHCVIGDHKNNRRLQEPISCPLGQNMNSHRKMGNYSFKNNRLCLV